MSYLPDGRVVWLVVHYSATPIDGPPVSIKTIDAWHRREGYREVGYHVYIRRDGTVEYGRDLSQPGRFEQGAHSQGENDESIGICYEGGVTKAKPNTGFDSRTPAQRGAMVRVIDELLERFPDAVVRGHRDMPGAATQCPGFDATAWWDDVQYLRNNNDKTLRADGGQPARPNPLQALFDIIQRFLKRRTT